MRDQHRIETLFARKRERERIQRERERINSTRVSSVNTKQSLIGAINNHLKRGKRERERETRKHVNMADQERLKSSRQRNIAQALRKVDAAGREAAISARLDALERDALPDDDEGGGGDTMDEEFVVEEPKLDGAMTKIVPASKKKKKGGGEGGGSNAKGGGRATRGAGGDSSKALSAKALRTFNQLLEANALDRAPVGIPTYTSIAAGPPSSGAPRKFCSVCGFPSPYTCSRCGMRFCCRKCNQIHSETRCLKMLG